MHEPMLTAFEPSAHRSGTRKWSGSKVELDHPKREGDGGFYARPAVSGPSELDPKQTLQSISPCEGMISDLRLSEW